MNKQIVTADNDFSNFVKARGDVHLLLCDAQGNIIEDRMERNLVVTVGKGHVTSRLVGVAQAAVGWMAVGTTNTAPAAGDTTLAAEVGGSRTALSSYVQGTTTTANDNVTATCTFGAGIGTGALVEAGLFNASSAGTLLARTVFSVINKGASDSLTITWKVTFS